MQNFYQAESYGPENALGYLLRRAHKLAMNRAETCFQGQELSFTQWMVLALIRSGTAATCTELARNIGHNSGAMSRMVELLQSRGFLVREPDAKDRRIFRLELTEKGRETTGKFGRKTMALWNDLLEDFDRDELLAMINTLNQLVKKLEAAENQTGQ